MKTSTLLRALVTCSFLFTVSLSRAQTSLCPTDLNDDGITDGLDYAIFSPQFGISCPGGGTPCPTDFNNDGVTDVNDFIIFAAKYGQRDHVLIFGISTATFSSGYVDVPLTISSDANISSFDFAMRFNLAKLTYDSVISVPFPSNLGMGYYNPTDLFLRYTSSILSMYYPNDTQLLVIRFTTSSGSLSNSDFSSINAILNGTSCGYILK